MVSLPENKNLNDVEIWHQDESRIGQQNTVTRIWAKKGTRPRVVRQRQFNSTYIFGAVCPKENKGAAIVVPRCNSYFFELHLQEISKQVTPEKHAVLVVDRAAWHMSTKLNIPENISLLPQPPYAPELNPMEQVWQFLKQKYLANRVFEDYEAILNACCDAWNAFLSIPEKIKTLCSRSWTEIRNDITV